MKFPVKYLLSLSLLASACLATIASANPSASAQPAPDTKKSAKIITYPAPKSEKMAVSSYTVSVNGKPVDIYRALAPVPGFSGGEYYFCYFDFEGEVEVKVDSRFPFTKDVGYSASLEEKAAADKIFVGDLFPNLFKNVEKQKHRISFTADKPFKTVVIRNERAMPLVIFGNPLEKDAPNPADKNVLYFGAGVHCVDNLTLKDNQTLYIAGGAVVKGLFKATSAKNITIRGRGILSCDNISRNTSWGCLQFVDCENVKIEGIITKDPQGWTLAFFNCNNVLIDNMKICSGRMINDDSIDICNTSNVKILNTFARSEDDIIAVKGIYKVSSRFGIPLADNLPCENIEIDNCIFWSDASNIFRIGYECYASAFKNLKCTNLYVPFYSKYNPPFTDYWTRGIFVLQPCNGIKISDMTFENIVVRSDGNDMNMVFAEPRIVKYGDVGEIGAKGEYGSIENCSFRNVRVVGKKGKFKGSVFIRGRDESHTAKNVLFSGFNYFKKYQKSADKTFIIGEHTENISVKVFSLD